MISKLSRVMKVCTICMTVLIFSCSKEKQLNNTNERVDGKYKKEEGSILSTDPIHPLTVTSTVTGTKITLNWIKPADFPSNATSVVTTVTYSGSMGSYYTFYVYSGGTTHSFLGLAGETYSITVTINYYSNGQPMSVSDNKDVSIPSTATTNPSDCATPTAQMSFPEEIEYAAPNGGTLYKQDNQIIVKLPPDYSSNQLWVIRYKKNDLTSTWQYSNAFPSSGTILNNRNFNFLVFNGLDGEYVFELGISCSGTPTNFTNTSYASTTVM